MYTLSSNFKRRLNLCTPLYYYGEAIVEGKKTQTKNLTVFMVVASHQVALLNSYLVLVSINVSEQTFP